MPISPHHPIRHFLFCIEGIARDEHVDPMKTLVAEIAKAGEWVLGPPEFVDEIQALDDDDDPDWEPLRTVGGVFRMYSSLPPTFLETETDRRHYEEVLLTLKTVEKFTLLKKIAVKIVLDGDTIGIVNNGKINRELALRLIEPWRKSLHLDK